MSDEEKTVQVDPVLASPSTIVVAQEVKEEEDANKALKEEGKEEEEEEEEEEEVGDEAFVENLSDKDYDPALVLELGDRIVIESTEYGPVWGTVYYRDNTLLRLRPDSAGNVLFDFPRDYDPETKTDKFQDFLDVNVSHIIKKRQHPEFVKQQDFQVGQTLASILENGKPGAFYRIRKLNEEKDSIKIVNIDDPDDKITIDFRWKGIPLEAPFRVLRIAAPPGVDLKEEWEKARKVAAAAAGVPVGAVPEEEAKEAAPEEEGDADLEELAEDEIQILDEDEIVVPQETVVREIATSKKVIPENLQKADAINDFLNMWMRPIVKMSGRFENAVYLWRLFII